MSEFEVYLQLGFQHITDLQGFDHMAFLLALCAVFTLADWRKVLVLATAFTLGHSLTLALAALDVVRPDPGLIETLIPVTIILTALSNFFYRKGAKLQLRYFLAFLFGLIHGLGFSSYLKMLLMGEESVVWPLFSFNIGLELGQILVIAGLLALSWAIVRLSGISSTKLGWGYSLLAIAASVYILWA